MSIERLQNGQWLNEPDEWRLDDGALKISTGNRTDFWQNTHYGFERDDGHALLVPAEGDFTAYVTFEGQYEQLYDQCGMLVRANAKNWIKCGIEYSDDTANFSCVVTRQNSDWSVVAQSGLRGPQQVRLTRIADAIIVHFVNARGEWQLIRLADFPRFEKIGIGPMACSPQRAGFKVDFTHFVVQPAIANPLHG